MRKYYSRLEIRSHALEFTSRKIQSVPSAAWWTRTQAAQLFSKHQGCCWICSALFVAKLLGKSGNLSREDGLSLLSGYCEALGKPVLGGFPSQFPPFWACFMSKPLSSCLVAKNKCYQEVLLLSAQSHSTERLWQKIAFCRLLELQRGSWIPWGSCRRG